MASQRASDRHSGSCSLSVGDKTVLLLAQCRLSIAKQGSVGYSFEDLAEETLPSRDKYMCIDVACGWCAHELFYIK